jgi:hypothetical protein
MTARACPNDYGHLSTDELIAKYHKDGFPYKDIVNLLSRCHAKHLTYDAVKKRVQRFDAKLPSRRGPTSHSRADISRAIQLLLPTLPPTAGYRNVFQTLVEQGYHVRRDTVMDILREQDAAGCAFRRRRALHRRQYISPGPDFAWHVDGKG